MKTTNKYKIGQDVWIVIGGMLVQTRVTAIMFDKHGKNPCYHLSHMRPDEKWLWESQVFDTAATARATDPGT